MQGRVACQGERIYTIQVFVTWQGEKLILGLRVVTLVGKNMWVPIQKEVI